MRADTGLLQSLKFLITIIIMLCPLAQAAVPKDCVIRGEEPEIKPPWPDPAALCAASHGKPASRDLIPPVAKWPQADEAYSAKLKDFIVSRDYANKLGWLHDLKWRLTGPYEGCPNVSEGKYKGESFGVHPAVKIYYSPEVIDWVCKGRKGPLPDGAMIIKEMLGITQIGVNKQSNMWLPQKHYETNWSDAQQKIKPQRSWTLMVKAQKGSTDGWYWANYTNYWIGNPPIKDASATVTAPGDNFFKNCQPPNGPCPQIKQHDAGYYPTGTSMQSQGNITKRGAVVYPYYGFGNYCINCHASATSESTFSNLETLLGTEKPYEYREPDPATTPGIFSTHLAPLKLAAGSKPQFNKPLPQPDPAFLKQFPEIPGVSVSEAVALRFPAETYDHNAAQGHPENNQQFLTSDQCLQCHDAGGKNMIAQQGAQQINLSPYGEWRASPMGLGGRDPIFLSQLQNETNLLPEQKDCIENTCLSCHGVMGQRQIAIDYGEGDKERCTDLKPTKAKKLFTRDILKAWPGDKPELAKYGGLGRDGISCTVCHHISEKGLADPSTYTGQFNVGPPQQLFGPFEKDLKQKPMEHALGITPEYKQHIRSSDLCGSCHTIELPVFDKGKVVEKKFEQTTYLEWRNSAYAKGWKPGTGTEKTSCQDCHMSNHFNKQKLAFKIANIEDNTFPHVSNRLPDDEIDLKERTGYARHTLYGLNVFINEMFVQYPVLLGLRQIDYMNTAPQPMLLTARESVLQQARQETASVVINNVNKAKNVLTVDITVQNKTGHNLPSGVGFRRMFVNFEVLDKNGEVLWASGRTNSLGVIVKGTGNTPLPSEFFQKTLYQKQAYQTHHQVITAEDQVQIYEELVQNAERRFTTSFLHRRYDIKDNRLRPLGWDAKNKLAKYTEPHGKATQDPDYTNKGQPLTGKDSIRYKVTLSAAEMRQAHQIKVELFNQSIPPYYLKQRFDSARKGPGRDDIKRLYYLTSHLNVNATDASNKTFIKDWKLSVGNAQYTFTTK